MRRPMSPEQKRVASWIALGFLFVGVLAVWWLAYLTLASAFVNNPEADDPELYLSWKIFVWFTELGATAKTAFATIITVITAGVAAAGEFYRSKSQIALIAVASLSGIAGCVILMVLTADDSNGEILRYFSNYDTLSQLKRGVNTFAWSIVAWFSFFLASQLGISALKQGGVLREILSRVSR